MHYDISFIRSNTVKDFIQDLCTDHWNEIVYRLILDAQNKKINYKSINTDETQSPIDNNSKNIKTNSLSFNLKVSKFLTELVHKFYQPEIFIINSYLSRINEIKLQLLLKELPLNYKRPIFDPKIDYKDNINDMNNELDPINFVINENSSWDIHNKDFLLWFNKILPFFIPCNYSLKFANFYEDMKKLPFPKKPKLIFTSVLHVIHDYFNLYTSEKVYSGTKYIIGQHGGAFRSMEVCYLEDMHKNLPDYYLTWGKDNLNDDAFPAKVIAVGNIKTSSKKIAKNNRNIERVLLLTIEYPRHSYVLTSAVISSQWLEYYHDLKNFIQKTSDLGLGEKLIIRNKLRSRGYGWNMGNKLLNEFPNLKYDEITDYYNSIQSSSLVISTYNGATYLETMSLNIPTIFFWNPSFWELNNNSKDDYNELSKVGIFHTNPISAAKFYSEIKHDINSWWFSEKVQSISKKFCEKYSKRNKNISYEIMNIIKNSFK